jgi:hypothetical protein
MTYLCKTNKENMKFIKLTSIEGGVIVVNVEHIGHFYPSKVATISSPKYKEFTKVGVTTHNNGGFSVTETVDEIMKLINKM